MTLLLAAGGACVANWFSLNECALVTWEIFSVLNNVYFQNPIHLNFIGYVFESVVPSFLAQWSQYTRCLANALYHCTFCHLIFWICSICHQSIRTIITHVFDLTPRPIDFSLRGWGNKSCDQCEKLSMWLFWVHFFHLGHQRQLSDHL